jgi:transcriptional regulator with XRE-family HTH domain
MTTTDITAAATSRLAVGTRIRRRRLELAATMPEFEALAFARRLGITVGHLYHVETGRVGVSAELLERIAILLGLDVHRLLAANGQIAPSLDRALLSKPERWAEIERACRIKIHIENKSSLDISQVARIVAGLLHEEIDFLLANTVRGCQFTFKGVIVAMYPTSKEHPAGEMAFIVADADEKEGKTK